MITRGEYAKREKDDKYAIIAGPYASHEEWMIPSVIRDFKMSGIECIVKKDSDGLNYVWRDKEGFAFDQKVSLSRL